MAAPTIPDEEIEAAAEAYKTFGSERAAAKAVGMPRSSFQLRIRYAAARGMLSTNPVMRGYHIKSVSTQEDEAGKIQKRYIRQVKEPGAKFQLPPGHEVKAVSALLDADGRTMLEWRKTRVGELTIEETVNRIKKAFEGYKPASPKSRTPTAPHSSFLTLIPCNDWHVGMFGWGKEVENNWDLKIAERVIGAAIEDVIDRSPSSLHGVVLGGGDLLHADNSENKTAKSGNVLDVDGRYQKVVDVACRLMARTVDAALLKHKHVTVRILKGNHDEHACVAVAYFLLAWYRNDKRVTVDVDPSLYWWMRFGQVMLGATHGHLAKLKDMPSIMAHRRAEDWGATKFRYIHGFHIHHREKLVTEGNGCICEAHQAPIPQDSWHYGKGFLSGRSVQAITYHKQFGEWGRVHTVIMDAT